MSPFGLGFCFLAGSSEEWFCDTSWQRPEHADAWVCAWDLHFEPYDLDYCSTDGMLFELHFALLFHSQNALLPFFSLLPICLFPRTVQKKNEDSLGLLSQKRKVEEHSVVGEILLARPMNLSCIFHLDSCYLCEHTFQFEQQVHSLLAPPRSTPHPPKSSWSWIKPLPSSFSVC